MCALNILYKSINDIDHIIKRTIIISNNGVTTTALHLFEQLMRFPPTTAAVLEIDHKPVLYVMLRCII